MKKIITILLAALLAPSMAFAAPTFKETATSAVAACPTFTAQDIGIAAADRDVILMVGQEGSAGAVTSGATIGGVTATLSTTTPILAGVGKMVAFIANVPTGTTADIVFTCTGGNPDSLGVAIYTDNNVNLTFFDSADDAKIGATPNPKSFLDIPSSGFVLGLAYTANDAATSYTWTGVTENYDLSIRGNTRFSGGVTAPAGSTNYEVSALLTGASVEVGLLSISYQYNAAAVTASQAWRRLIWFW